jgi:hypothetical protein
MTQWINPIDKLLPQMRQDYANHLIYGGIVILFMFCDFTALQSTIIVLIVGGVKKSVDYFKEFETLKMCILKTLIGGVWGASILLLQITGKL